VETNLAGETWGAVWRHQLRWARTIRVSQPGGYYGYVVTHATLWSLAAILSGSPRIGLTALAIRLFAGLLVGLRTLRDRNVLRYFYLIPLRDLWGFAVWICGLFGDTVEWRGQRLRLTRDGRIRE
jgi:ceramide glucosyltransferase